MRDLEGELFKPDKTSTSTPKTNRIPKVDVKLTPKLELRKVEADAAIRNKKGAGSKSAKSAKSANNSKRNRSGGSGLTPEGKKQSVGGITDESAEAFGEFSRSLEKDGDTEAGKIDVIVSEKRIFANTSSSALKRASPEEQDGNTGPKPAKMSKRSGIEIRFFKRWNQQDRGSSLTIEEWQEVKAKFQEYLFTKELDEIFDKIVHTPFNSREKVHYGLFSFANVEDMEETYKIVMDGNFGLKFMVAVQPIRPTDWEASFRITGMLEVDPRRIFDSMIKRNKLAGGAISVEAWLTKEKDARYFKIRPDDVMTEDLRAREEKNELRLKTGFSATTVRIYKVEGE